MTAMSGSTRVIAHRGASAARPENTLAAFTHARELGADGVELDARWTADGHVVVHHDAHLPDGRALVELERADLPEWLPTLDQVLDRCQGLLVNVEIKNDPGDPDHDPSGQRGVAIADRLSARAGGPELLVSSFDHALVGLVHDRHPELPTAALVAHTRRPERLLERLAQAGHAAVNPVDALVDRTFVDLARAAGLAVYVWTVDDPARIAQLAALGVDGVITNVPDVARSVLMA
jgi:glycerophosphoryl diester phosphodiesterase